MLIFSIRVKPFTHFLRLRGYNKYHKLCGLNNTNVFPIVVDDVNLRPGPGLLRFGEGPLTVKHVVTLLYLSCQGRERKQAFM